MLLGFVAHGCQSDASVLWPRGRQCDVLSVSVIRWALWPMAVSLMHRFCGLVAVKCDVLDFWLSFLTIALGQLVFVARLQYCGWSHLYRSMQNL